jgi:DNA-binding protein HU-beta
MANGMTKKELVNALAEAAGTDRKAAGAVLDALAAVAGRTVAAGGTLALPGIGKLTVRDRPAREVRNPATGAKVMKPADRTVKFAVAKALKDGAGA